MKKKNIMFILIVLFIALFVITFFIIKKDQKKDTKEPNVEDKEKDEEEKIDNSNSDQLSNIDDSNSNTNSNSSSSSSNTSSSNKASSSNKVSSSNKTSSSNTTSSSTVVGKTTKGYNIEKINGIYYVKGILIANKTYSLPSNYNPGSLTNEFNIAFNNMKKAAAEDGINLWVQSGFRSYNTQKTIYNNYVSKDGKSIADTYSARPGHSEHQSGLAADLNQIKDAFADTKEGKWLNDNCYKYGFILRYPKGKQEITGYKYEPWHFRFIGEEAVNLYNSGNWITLEEYLGIDSKYQ